MERFIYNNNIFFNPEHYEQQNSNQYLFQHKGNEKIISFITHYSSICMSNLSGHFSTIINDIILELMLMEKEVYEGPSDLVYKIIEVTENQEPPLGVTASSNTGGYSGQVR